MIHNNQPVSKVTRKGRRQDTMPREPEQPNPSRIAETRAQDVYEKVYMVDCCVFASCLPPIWPLLRANFCPASSFFVNLNPITPLGKTILTRRSASAVSHGAGIVGLPHRMGAYNMYLLARLAYMYYVVGGIYVARCCSSSFVHLESPSILFLTSALWVKTSILSTILPTCPVFNS